ncbi:hypothetical protein BO78DRAFT_442654 [Aspergillus sclerotiicarbonarius CBS 121057]|uniref:MYND-type domain-containing protein n=1 Tax=Aspergillus sclerotiicarbonarius (strain CBS 121057 / IBT 28362) TaxID=1448318 RepID=A0A319EC72_ASPSB|nr:hypothetical protein BO78DRAFT_442654 [Aspergillus sclerotiicarbonarius CBS 121057]
MDSTIIPSGCGFCGTYNNLIHCNGCQIMSYCSQDHKVAHKQSHQAACHTIMSLHNRIKLTESRLPFNLKIVMNPSEDLQRYPRGPIGDRLRLKGLSWQDGDERVYMGLRFQLVKAMSKILTRDSLQAQLSHVMGLLRLSDCDHMGLRRIAPVLMFRLNQDQECYNFLKWWSVAKHARVSEQVFKCLARSPIISERCELLFNDKVRQDMIERLLIQVEKLYASVESKNGYYWPALVSSEIPLNWKPATNRPGSLEEMQHILNYTYDAWMETPGAIQFIRTRARKQVRGQCPTQAESQIQRKVQRGIQDQDQHEGWTIL